MNSDSTVRCSALWAAAFVLTASSMVGCAAPRGTGDPADSPSWPTAAHTSSSDPTSRIDDHIGGMASPERYVRSPFDRFVLTVDTRPDPEHPRNKLWQFVVRTYTPRSDKQGAIGKVVHRDSRWYGDDLAGATWDRGTDQVWILVQHSRYTGGRSEIRRLAPQPDANWAEPVFSPAEDNELPSWIREGATADAFTTRPGWSAAPTHLTGTP
ncbi:hypothetical protein [Yinghuangia seranimata]|uniref:hypothetical protein n=1 Tax=Yinghuangia seranimata TaxID=408067 RepID=UPI00248C31F7|nr:hypothetical protein [Yinghuangia seranimata]MDI2128183.1 hypothetical protein [Yinghuangia seranimata]